MTSWTCMYNLTKSCTCMYILHTMYAYLCSCTYMSVPCSWFHETVWTCTYMSVSCSDTYVLFCQFLSRWSGFQISQNRILRKILVTQAYRYVPWLVCTKYILVCTCWTIVIYMALGNGPVFKCFGTSIYSFMHFSKPSFTSHSPKYYYVICQWVSQLSRNTLYRPAHTSMYWWCTNTYSCSH